MLKRIEEVLDQRFAYENDTVYYPCDDNGFDIFDTVIQMFIDAEFPPEDFSVQLETVFTSPGLDISIMSIAFVDWGKLYHETFTIESR